MLTSSFDQDRHGGKGPAQVTESWVPVSTININAWTSMSCLLNTSSWLCRIPAASVSFPWKRLGELKTELLCTKQQVCAEPKSSRSNPGCLHQPCGMFRSRSPQLFSDLMRENLAEPLTCVHAQISLSVLQRTFCHGKILLSSLSNVMAFSYK